jgi:peptide/nickel transport system substrate-binding protein
LFDMSRVSFGPGTLALMNQSALASPSSQLRAIMTNTSWPIYVVDNNTIAFRLTNPFAYFLGTLVTEGGLIYDAQWAMKNGGLGTPSSPNSYFNQNPIPGTGPYQFTKVAENAYVQFTQNPTYWGRNLTAAQIAANPALDPGHVKNVIIYDTPDDLARYTDLSTGGVQIAAIQNADWNLVQQGADKYQYTILPPESGLVTGLAMNVLVYPTNITAVRQAIAHAINYTELSNKLFFGKMSPWVGPEYPAWNQYYNLGNFSQYQYNVTLAKQYLAKANVSNPTLTYNLENSCGYCVARAEVVQGDLAQIGITVNLVVLTSSNWCAQLCGSYSTNVQNPSPLGNLNDIGGSAWAPGTLTPADFWNTFVSNASFTGNGAIYSNPAVQACVNAFTSLSNTTQIQSLCKAAQQQIYNDAPYVWFGVLSLWYAGGSEVWQKGVVSNFYLDPVWTGYNTEPLFNTVTFG